jgi:cyclopropane-fatty-acyl-phospholipid synthase
MFEAVGREYWATYFKQIYKCLRPKGMAVIQTITIDNEIFNKYKKRTDFIQKYIFPGGVLPSKKIFRNMAEKCGLRVVEEYCFGFDYYLTIKIWLDNFDKSTALINELGFSDNFIRKWRFYLAYCMAGFASKRTDVVQFTLVKD